MSEYKYTLELYKTSASRHRCPGCGKSKKFSRYINRETGEYLHPKVGRCDRESSCGYHYTPKQYFQDNDIVVNTPHTKVYIKPSGSINQPKQISFISDDAFKASLKGYESNNFTRFLMNLFGLEVTSNLISQYFIASSKHWQGSTIFWQIDTRGKIRTGKIMLYNPSTGKRVKEPTNHITWAHSTLKMPEFALQQCLFGEHLLRETSKPVAIVESEKTAIIASAYLPQLIWLAVGSLSNLNVEKCRILNGRTVALFPDLNGFDKWTSKAKELCARFPGTTFNVSELLERKASESEKKQGLDLAHYLLRYNINEFIRQEPLSLETTPNIQIPVDTRINETAKYSALSTPKTSNWNHLITELEHYFATTSLPNIEIILEQGTTIQKVSGFLEGHFTSVKANNGNPTFRPYLDRLIKLKDTLEKPITKQPSFL